MSKDCQMYDTIGIGVKEFNLSCFVVDLSLQVMILSLEKDRTADADVRVNVYASLQNFPTEEKI